MTIERDPLWVKWRRYWRLPAFERKFVRRAMALLPLTRAGLRVLGFRRSKRIIERISVRFGPREAGGAGASDTKLDLARRIARASYSAELHGLVKPNCLERSLALWCLLRGEGLDAKLHIGGRKSGQRFEAHAWVELAGAILNDSPEIQRHYARFDAPIAGSEPGSGAFKETLSR